MLNYRVRGLLVSYLNKYQTEEEGNEEHDTPMTNGCRLENVLAENVGQVGDYEHAELVKAWPFCPCRPPRPIVMSGGCGLWLGGSSTLPVSCAFVFDSPGTPSFLSGRLGLCL